MSHRRHPFLALIAMLSVATAARASVFEYLYVEANAGSSAGGHFALRLDDWVYDFQNADLGTLRLRRTEYDHFRYLYTVLDNRTMHVARIDVPDATREAIFDRFNQRYLRENQRFVRLDSLRGDRELIALLLARARPPTARDRDRAALAMPDHLETRESAPLGLPIRGAGFFYDDRDSNVGEESPPLGALRDRVAASHGPTHLENLIAALEHTVKMLSPQTAIAASGVENGLDDRPESGGHFSDRYRELAAKILALRALEAAIPLRPSARRVPEGGEFALGSSEEQQIRVYAERLETRLARLVDSTRPDWGYSLLLGMARLEVLHESLEQGRWIVLDSIPADSEFLSSAAVKRRDPFVVELRDRAHAEFVEARAHFASASNPTERALAWLEEAINRYATFRHGFDQNVAIPIHELGVLPDRAASVRGLALPEVEIATLRRAADTAKRRENAQRAALTREFGYQLVSNNCVTEIFAMVGQGIDPVTAGDRPTEVDNRNDLLDFIPVVAYRKVLAAHSDAEPAEIPSLRRFRLEQMYAAENDLRVYLRESNTLTSTIYRRNDVEPLFLFFTEDSLPLRPVYGVLNFAAGIGEIAFGVLRSPWDRGRMFISGLKGAAFSVPELFFVNLRKGILEYAPGATPRTPRRPAPPRTSES